MNLPMRTLAVVLLLLAVAGTAAAQTVLLHVDRATDTIPSRVGPNLPRFNQLYLTGAFIAGPDEAGARVRYGASLDFGIGFRRKYKVSGLYALGWELALHGQSFRLQQDSGKTLPNSALNDRERLVLSQARLGFFQRFNFDPLRGNSIGTYLELGISGSWQTMQWMLRNKLPDGSVANSTVNRLPYDEPFGAQVNARLGRGHLALTGSWRLTGLFRPRYHYPELPRLAVGLELGIF